MDNGGPINANDEALLHRYVDGDLDATEAAEVDALLADSAGARSQHEAILRMQAMVGAAGEQMGEGLDSDSLFAAIESGIAADAAAETQTSPARTTAPERGGLAGLWEAFVHGKAWMPAAGMVAAVSAVLLTIYSPVDQTQLVRDVEVEVEDGVDNGADNGTRTEAASDTVDDARAAGDGPSAQVAATTHSEVVSVDFGQSAGTVFAIANDDGSSTPVIWINDDE